MKNIVRAIIVEDIAEYIGTIEMLLAEVAPWVRIVAKATTLTEAERLIGQMNPDVVFLDIQFENEGKTGFELLDSLRSRNSLNFQLIVITAHAEKHYYAKAFEYNAIHFLEKPLNKHKLANAVERIKDLLVGIKMEELVSKIGNEIGLLKLEAKPAKISIKGLRYNEIIDVNHIVWIEADGRKSNVYLLDEKKIASLDSIGWFEKQLMSNPDFFRINRSEIINISYIDKYSKKERLVVLKSGNLNHFVSREKFDNFIQKIE
jgi:two-component system, LytTR family, response regulator